MHPKGHLVTTAAAASAAYAATGSLPLVAGIGLGGFLIDLDHYFDYVAFERQYSLDPRRFLRYYLGCQCERAVLLLHSYELMAALAVIALLSGSVALLGYLLGGALHLTLDVIFNARVLREPVRFYSIAYRLRHGFEARALLRPGVRERGAAPPGALLVSR